MRNTIFSRRVNTAMRREEYAGLTHDECAVKMAKDEIEQNVLEDFMLNKIQTGEDPDAKPSKRKTVDPPTAEQLKQAEELSIDLDRLAAYHKVDVSELSKSDLADAIEMKKKSLQKKAEKEKKNAEAQQ